RAIDQLNAAGWSVNELQPKALQEIAMSFESRARACGFEFIHAADRAALTDAHRSRPLFTQLLISGFDGAHWPLGPLLCAAVTTAANATVVLSDPRDEA